MMKRRHMVRDLLFCVGLVAGPLSLLSAARADWVIGTPAKLGPTINTTRSEAASCLSADGLSLYFASDRGGGYGDVDIWVAHRATTDSEWELPSDLGPVVNSSATEFYPCLSADGLTLFFCDGVLQLPSVQRPGGYGDVDLWMTTRETQGGEWGQPVNLGPTINSPHRDGEPTLSADGLSLYFTSDRPGGYGGLDIYVVRRATIHDAWGPPVNLGPTVNSSTGDACPGVSPDERVLFFISGRPPLLGGSWDFWMAKRMTQHDDWETPVHLDPPISGPGWDGAPRVSPDGSVLYITVYPMIGEAGYYDLYQAPLIPTVDLVDDGIIDIDDLVILIEHWGQANSRCDIGPMPWGDGKVDTSDLEVLMSHWGQEPRLLARWKLNESDGQIAHDSTGNFEGTLHGDPLWQQAGGISDGALRFDGLDDYVSTPFVWDPSAGPFSVFAWVKGGTPGQVILSQAAGVNWLMAAAANGALTTELRRSGRQDEPLNSSTIITDGAWHRVGFVWDSGNRILYVDDIEVARDTKTSLAALAGGLYIGAGSALAPGSFWSGLIDDIRVYNRAVQP